jgi:hypothetical protein
MDVLPNRIYHLKISTNLDYEVLILVTQVWTQIWQGTINPKEVSEGSDSPNEIEFKLLASTIDLGDRQSSNLWSKMEASLFIHSSPTEIAPKDLPLYLTWPTRTPAFEEALKGVYRLFV